MTVRALVVGVLAVAGCDRVFSLDRKPDAPVEPDAPIPSDWVQIIAGDDTTCGIRDGGSLWCWGYNKTGQVGNSSTLIQVNTPAAVTGDVTWTQVSVGGDHACGIQMDGSLWCWGANAQGQLGINGLTEETAPVRVGSSAWSSVSAGIEHTCGIQSNGSLWCWGNNPDGRIGNGTNIDQPAPTPIMASTTWLAVSAGKTHTCGISADNRRWCWGDNGGSQLGIGNTNDQSIPTAGAETGAEAQWKSVVAGADVSCGILLDGRARCWGTNAQGQIGDGTFGNNRSVPTAVMDDPTTWDAIDSTGRFVWARRVDGTLWCWGDLESVFGLPHAPAPVQLAVDATTAIAAGRAHACRIDGDHGVWCVGDGSVGQRGDGTSGTLSPVQLAGAWTSVSGGSTSTCAVSTTGSLHCWGQNTAGQVGDGTARRRLTPTAIAVSQTFAEVVFGDRHGCALTSAGDTWCWGTNSSGSVGATGSNPSFRGTPVNVGGPFTQLTVRTHACAFDGSNALTCWGSNDRGQLGTGNTTDALVPTIMGNGAWSGVAAGSDFSCAISSTNSRVYCTGWNDNGQLGNGTTSATTPQLTYQATTDTTAMAAVYAGHDHACALDATTRLAKCWGDNGDGELGDGTRTDRATPGTVIGTHAWAELALGDKHSCGVRMDGALLCWGDNDRGQLGVDSYQPKVTPTQVGTDTSWSHVTVGDEHTCALKTDNSLWCWGDNRDGQLGTGAGWSATWTYVPRPL